MAIPAIHPGEHLAEELRELDMSAAALARQIQVPTNRITGILNRRRAITGDTALRLGHFFGTSPEFWLNLQKALRVTPCREEGRPRNRSTPNPPEPRDRPHLTPAPRPTATRQMPPSCMVCVCHQPT